MTKPYILSTSLWHTRNRGRDSGNETQAGKVDVCIRLRHLSLQARAQICVFLRLYVRSCNQAATDRKTKATMKACAWAARHVTVSSAAAPD